MDKVCFKAMGGGGKPQMKDEADKHFDALKQIIPQVSKLMLFDFDSRDDAFHPSLDNPGLSEWARKNIENYLLVPDAWIRAAARKMQCGEDDLFAQPVVQVIREFFCVTESNLASWENLAKCRRECV